MKKAKSAELLQRYYVYKYRFIDKVFPSVNQAKILMFHHIIKNNATTNYSCQSTMQHFIDVINKIKSHQLEFVGIDEALNKINNKQYRGYCVMTFDDGHEDVFLNAYPLLKQQNIPFAIYLVTSFLDTEGYLSCEQVKILSADPLCTIGAHTLNHLHLRECKNALQEICKSKVVIEELIQKEVNHFAYPYGSMIDCSRKNLKQVKKCDYKSAVSTIPACINWFSTRNKIYLPRINGDYYEK